MIILEKFVLFDIYYLTSTEHLLILKSYFYFGCKKSVILIKNYPLGMPSKVSMGEWCVIWNCLVNDLAEEKLAKRRGGKCVCGQYMHATPSPCTLLSMCSKFSIIIIFHNFSKGKFNWKANLSINILCWPQSLTSCAFQESSMYSVKVNKAKKIYWMCKNSPSEITSGQDAWENMRRSAWVSKPPNCGASCSPPQALWCSHKWLSHPLSMWGFENEDDCG